MSNLSSLWLSKEKLETLLKGVEAKNEKGIELTISTSDEVNDYGQNVSAYVSQTKEEREAKKDRFYVGNGKVFWTDGQINVAPKKEQPANLNESDGDSLPF